MRVEKFLYTLAMSDTEKYYQNAIDQMSPKDRMARSVALLKWARELVARQIRSEFGPMSDERLRWEVALRMYGRDPRAREMIENELANVSS